MRRLIALAVLVACAAPAFGQECSFISEDGARLTQEPGQVTIANPDGSVQACTLKGNGPANPVLTGICADGFDWPFFMVSSAPGGAPDIVIFINTAWYQDCAGQPG